MLTDILTAIERVTGTTPIRTRNGYKANCPAHDDTNPSLSIGMGDNGVVLLHCFAGCEFESVMMALEQPTSKQLAPLRQNTAEQIVKTYYYHDANGRVLFCKHRFEPKRFAIAHPNGNGRFTWGMGDTEPVLYRLPQLIASETNKPVFIVEGEKDVDVLAVAGYESTTNFDGAGKWRAKYNNYLNGRTVWILPDNDEEGRRHAQKVAQSLYGVALTVKVVELPGLAHKQDVSDWLADGNTVQELYALCLDAPEWEPMNETAVIDNQPELNAESGFSTFADIARLTGEIEWAWQSWLAKGYLHLLASESGIGKSFVAMRIAGCFLSGLPWPNGEPFEAKTGLVLWCEAEAAQQLNKERAKILGLPLEKIIIPSSDPFHDIDLRNHQDKDLIGAWANNEQVRFIVVDSLSGADPREENDSSKLAVLKWWAELARNTGKPILITHHLNKPFGGSERITLHRLRGSTAIPQLARVIWAMDTPDPNNREQKRLLTLKNNLAAFPEPIGVTIGENVQFGEAPTPPRQYTKLDRAMDFLRDLLENGPVSAKEVEFAAESQNLSISTLNRAKTKMGITSFKVKHNWYWSLPVPDTP